MSIDLISDILLYFGYVLSVIILGISILTLPEAYKNAPGSLWILILGILVMVFFNLSIYLFSYLILFLN